MIFLKITFVILTLKRAVSFLWSLLLSRRLVPPSSGPRDKLHSLPEILIKLFFFLSWIYYIKLFIFHVLFIKNTSLIKQACIQSSVYLFLPSPRIHHFLSVEFCNICPHYVIGDCFCSYFPDSVCSGQCLDHHRCSGKFIYLFDW